MSYKDNNYRDRRNNPRFTKPVIEEVEATEERDECLIEGRHAIREAIRSGRSLNKLMYTEEGLDASAREIIATAKKAGIVTQPVNKARLDSLSENGKHQGLMAVAAAYDYSTVEDIFVKAAEKNEDPLIIILDGISDPHNLGSIIRTAVCCGAHGVIIPKHRAVGITGTVVKVSAGAVEFMPVARVTNLNRTIDELKDKGVWVCAADMGGENLYSLNMKGPLAIVIGSEGDGVSRLTLDKCDFVASIPLKGEIESLNASVAAAIVMYEAVRQRQ